VFLHLPSMLLLHFFIASKVCTHQSYARRVVIFFLWLACFIFYFIYLFFVFSLFCSDMFHAPLFLDLVCFLVLKKKSFPVSCMGVVCSILFVLIGYFFRFIKEIGFCNNILFINNIFYIIIVI